jgi:hypothetical protein
VQSAPDSALRSPCRLAAPPTVEQTPGGADPGDRSDSHRSSFVLGNDFLDARVVSLRADDADGWSVGDGRADGPEILG